MFQSMKDWVFPARMAPLNAVARITPSAGHLPAAVVVTNWGQDLASAREQLQAASSLSGYSSLLDLRDQLQDWDHPTVGGQLFVILILHEHFNGHLPTLIQRQVPALRLRIVPLGTALPGVESPGDILLAGSRLGWCDVQVGWDWADVLKSTFAEAEYADQVAVFWPRWQAELRQEFQGLPVLA